MEGVHPQFNQLVNRFGNTRGGRRQQLVMNEFLFSHATWARETIDEMIEETSRKPKKKKQKKTTKKKAGGGLTSGRGHSVAESAPAAAPTGVPAIQLAAAKTDQGMGGRRGARTRRVDAATS